VHPGGFDHLAVQVDDLTATRARLIDQGLDPSAEERPGGPEGPRTAWLEDPDGYRIELVEWPPGHPYGLTAADFATRDGA
jgi:lactoylglutathione lyase